MTAPAGTIAFPSAEALRTLDGLRAVLDTVHGYEVDGPPMHMRWGLWRGAALLDAGRRVWIEGYRTQLHTVAWGALVDSLRALPDTPRPTDDYGRDYANLKAYLVTTAEPKRSTPDFLAPVLLASWQRGQPADTAVATLAQRQFAFYAAMLPTTNPFPQPADAALVGRTRAFLARFKGAEAIYQYMLAEAAKVAPPARLLEIAPAAAGVVSAQAEVPGPFTAKGWAFMEGAFRDSDRFFQGEQWVVGDGAASDATDRTRILAELRARYRSDYVEKWRAFIRTAAVARPGTMRASSQQLGIVGGAQSPLLAAIALTSRNTLVDSAVSAAFQPVQAVAPGAVTDKFVSEKNQPYAGALLTLQSAIEQIVTQPPPTDTAGVLALRQAGTLALTQASNAKVAARQLAQSFAVDPEAGQVGPAVAALLMAPIEYAEATLRNVGSTAMPRAPRVGRRRRWRWRWRWRWRTGARAGDEPEGRRGADRHAQRARQGALRGHDADARQVPLQPRCEGGGDARRGRGAAGARQRRALGVAPGPAGRADREAGAAVGHARQRAGRAVDAVPQLLQPRGGDVGGAVRGWPRAARAADGEGRRLGPRPGDHALAGIAVGALRPQLAAGRVQLAVGRPAARRASRPSSRRA